jgi:Baseplate J-like protein
VTLQSYVCTDTRRRRAVVASSLNGIDFVEILDADAPSPADRQRLLRVSFLKSPPPAGLEPANFVISGGDRITLITVDNIATDGNTLLLHLSAYGDYSTYQLTIQGAAGSSFDPSTLDPLFASVRFSFKVDCPSDFDCQAEQTVSTPWPRPPLLDYLSKDYTSFRQVMLDRITSLAPDWQERNAADLGVTLVELSAHVGDLLSYRQDAIATEAYLGTARRRVSVRRHARLVDYFVQEGVNARAFLQVQVNADTLLPKGMQVFTELPGQAARIGPTSPDLASARALDPEIFETMHDASLFHAHSEIAFYTWGDTNCRLPQGSTSATLRGQFPNLHAGDILIFEEALGPRTGQPGDANPQRRCAVRLTSVTPRTDPVGGAFETPATTAPAPVTVIEWHRDDATPFAFQISGEVLSRGVAQQLDNISVARGNVVLADHGATVVTETVGQVPAPTLYRPPAVVDGFPVGDPTPIAARFRPQLKSSPLVHAVPYDPSNPPASALATLTTAPADAVPFIKLSSTVGGQPPVPWSVARDLLQSGSDALDFVVETESDGSAWLRFGDDTYGQRPAPGTVFTAQYRIGDPSAGNVAADAIGHAVSADPAVAKVRNPLPATGGVAPESIEHVRATAPFAFRVQQRAVTPDDYQAAAERHPEVQRAAATFRWTGSWHTLFLTVDRLGGLPVDDAFVEEMQGFLEPFRLAGHDLQVDGPKYVPLDIAMLVTARADHFQSDVKRALLQVFGTGVMLDGRREVFNPDNFTFGQPVNLSVIYAAAQAVDGVAAVEVTKFERRDRPGDGLSKGRLDFARLEIPRLDNNPDFPERGSFQVTMRGGK